MENMTVQVAGWALLITGAILLCVIVCLVIVGRNR